MNYKIKVTSRLNLFIARALCLLLNAIWLVGAEGVVSCSAQTLKKADSTKTSPSKKSLPKQVPAQSPGQNLIVTGFNVHVRENPSTGSENNGQLKFGTIVRSIEHSENRETIGGKQGLWHKITPLNGKNGWVFGAFLKSFDQNKRENIYQQIAAEKFKVANRSFDENVELYDFLTRAQGETKTPVLAAEIGLSRLLALKSALAAVPVDKLQQPPYKNFTDANSINIVYSEPGGMWLVRSERFWSLAKKYAGLPVGERVAWEASQNSLPGECEGYLNCHLYVLRVTDGEYLARFPKGSHAAEALKTIGDSLQPVADDSKKKEIYSTPVDVSDRADFYKKIAELRTIISRTGFYEKEAILRKLSVIAEGYR